MGSKYAARFLSLLAAIGLVGLAALAVRDAAPAGAASADHGVETAAATSPWDPPVEPRSASLDYDHFETIDAEDGLPSNKVTTVLVDGDEVWVGTDRGVARRRGAEWSTWSESAGLGHRYVTSLARDLRTGDIWIATFGGLSRLSGGVVDTFTQLDSGLMNDVVYDVEVHDGQVWAATAAGTSRFDTTTGTWALYDTESSIMHEPWCYAVTHGPGRTWIGVWGGGIVELDHRTGLWREYRDPDHEMEIDLLRDDGPIHDVTAFVAWDAGLLWQATYFGLSRYDGLRWTTYRKEDSGLPGNFVNHVSARGRIAFLGTDEGFGATDAETFVTYRRTDDGRGERIVTRGGELVERTTLATAPADNYVLWTLAGDDDVWLATGSGLTHGTLTTPRERSTP